MDKHTSDLLNAFFEENLIPTITKPTGITHTSAIDNIHVYAKLNKRNLHRGIILSDISDHFPMFCVLQQDKGRESPKKTLI